MLCPPKHQQSTITQAVVTRN